MLLDQLRTVFSVGVVVDLVLREDVLHLVSMCRLGGVDLLLVVLCLGEELGGAIAGCLDFC